MREMDGADGERTDEGMEEVNKQRPGVTDGRRTRMRGGEAAGDQWSEAAGKSGGEERGRMKRRGRRGGEEKERRVEERGEGRDFSQC